MALRRKLQWGHLLLGDSITCHSRSYSSKVDFRKLRPMILKRIQNRAKDYPVQAMVPVAQEVLNARSLLIQGISTLMKFVPVLACKFCPEVYIGDQGHLIQTCWGYRRRGRNRVHEWVPGVLKDILVPVETFQLDNTFQGEIKHEQRFDYDRVPAVVELCRQAGADLNGGYSDNAASGIDGVESLSYEEMSYIANGTLDAWEAVRSGVRRLLMVYPAKVCEHCKEVHVGVSGHKARLCGVFKYETWHGTHFWKKASVDDLVPPKIVWARRPQDPPVLRNEGRDFYGHAPAVVDLCSKAGAIVPSKYFCMMKNKGASPPIWRFEKVCG
ncbi:APO protein 4, mitochondrial [Turnera subulata]|uniref:APO protein 4, mitochondrial n=1 Tax=Turnera subulata TaxID=218843 RepID=A0A9Q0IZC8_9ROSI|nr:APO protein 4, mitochondrial [Turnera subulata]